MTAALQPPELRAGVSFELDAFDLEDGRLVVRGQWFGVRGLRFVRPTLVIAGRPVLATLEHKPWAPDADPWVAAFPWSGGPVATSDVALAVAPSVTVPLDPAAEPPAAPVAPVAAPPKASAPQAAAPDPRLGRLESEVRALREELDEHVRAREALQTQLDQALTAAAAQTARAERLEQAAGREREAARDAAVDGDELHRARAAAEWARDQADAQRDEAIADGRAALRTRRRMETQRDEAVREREAAETARDAALSQRDEARAQRSEILVAHRALERRRTTELAASEREESGQPPREHAAITVPVPALDHPLDAPPPGSHAEDRSDAPTAQADAQNRSDVPLGVRTIPAARRVAADLHEATPTSGRDFSGFDLWAIRILGTVAAGCFILLLALILRAFLL